MTRPLVSTLRDVRWTDFDFIDMGSGTGGSLASAERCIGGRGIGIESNAIKVAEARASGKQVVHGDLFALPRDARVRYVVFDNVLEHLPDLDAVHRALAMAAEVAQEFVYIRHPSFEDEHYLQGFGLKQYWTDWRGHPAHIRLADFTRIFSDLGYLSWTFHGVRRATGSDDPTILPFDASPDQHDFDVDRHGPKPAVVFDRPVYYAYDIIARTTASAVHLRYEEDPLLSDRRPIIDRASGPVVGRIRSSLRRVVRRIAR